MFHYKAKYIFIFLPKDVVAIALFGHVFLRYSEEKYNPNTINHEKIHLAQMRHYGYFKFYFTYLFDYFKLRLRGLSHFRAYRNIPYEIEAYSNQDNMRYVSEKYKSKNS
jgi:hypothetical protein